MDNKKATSMIFNTNRIITKNEYINLDTKKNAIPVDYLRYNLFNATTRTSRELKRLKTIFDDGTCKILVNRSLHQRHRDLLSVIFTESKRIITNEDGSVEIRTSLYRIAKSMVYKYPCSSLDLVKGFLSDLRATEFTFKTNDPSVKYKEKGGHRLIGEYDHDTETQDYIIYIPAKTNQYKILNFAVEIPRKLNRRIISIPNSKSKIKALVSLTLSNKALRNGISLDNICVTLDIKNEAKSRFKKDLRSKENILLLKEFNISYCEDNKIIKYSQIDDIKFHRGMSIDEISKIISKEKLDSIMNKEFDKNNEDGNDINLETSILDGIDLVEELRENFVGFSIKHECSKTKENIVSKILDIEMKRDNDSAVCRLLLDRDDTKTSWIAISILYRHKKKGNVFKEK